MAPSVASKRVAASVDRGERPEGSNQQRRLPAKEAATSVNGYGQQRISSWSNGHKQHGGIKRRGRRQPAAEAASARGGGGGSQRRGRQQPAAGAAPSGGRAAASGWGRCQRRGGNKHWRRSATETWLPPASGGGCCQSEEWRAEMGRKPQPESATGGCGSQRRGRRLLVAWAAESVGGAAACTAVGGQRQGGSPHGGQQVVAGRLPEARAAGRLGGAGGRTGSCKQVGGHEWRQRGSRWHERWPPRGGSLRDGR